MLRCPRCRSALTGTSRLLSISGRRSAARWPIVSAELRPPQIALGYPWASSLVCRRHAQPDMRRWVAGVVEQSTTRERSAIGQTRHLRERKRSLPRLLGSPVSETRYCTWLPPKFDLSHRPPDLATGDWRRRPETRLFAGTCTNQLVPSASQYRLHATGLAQPPQSRPAFFH